MAPTDSSFKEYLADDKMMMSLNNLNLQKNMYLLLLYKGHGAFNVKMDQWGL